MQDLVPPPKLAPSLLSADFRNLGEQIRKVESSGADMLHFDIMDGHFVPNITFGPLVMRWLRGETSLIFTAHLMVDNPESVIEPVIDSGADIVIVHVESSSNLYRLIQSIKDRGIKAGVALNPATPLSSLTYLLEDVDMILIMGVDPGFGGQKLIPSTLKKIAKLRKILLRHGLPKDIAIDGGVTHDNVDAIVKAGANVIIAGTAIFDQNSIEEATRSLKKRCLEAYDEYISRLSR